MQCPPRSATMYTHIFDSLLLVAVALVLTPSRWWQNVGNAVETAINLELENVTFSHPIPTLKNLSTVNKNPSIPSLRPSRPQTVKLSVQHFEALSTIDSYGQSQRTRHSSKRKRRRISYAKFQSELVVPRARTLRSRKRDTDFDRPPVKTPTPTMLFGEDINYDFDGVDEGLDQVLNSTPVNLYGRSMSTGPKLLVYHKKKKDIWLFFTLSLSFFATIGIVLFIRRCVKCPHSMSGGSGTGPRIGSRLDSDKELPPVEYSAIPGTVATMEEEHEEDNNGDSEDNVHHELAQII